MGVTFDAIMLNFNESLFNDSNKRCAIFNVLESIYMGDGCYI